MLLIMGGAGMMFLAGVRIRLFVISAILVLVAIPVGLNQLHDYQRQRVLTFLDPASDPLGAGYHIQQSKIALGSGGVSGKGYMQGTQAHLDFLPEKQTDFIFTMLAEEFGFIGGLALLGLYALLIIYGYVIGLTARNQFARLLALGVTLTFFLYVFINIAMVMGLIPVVGVRPRARDRHDDRPERRRRRPRLRRDPHGRARADDFSLYRSGCNDFQAGLYQIGLVRLAPTRIPSHARP